MKDLSIAIVIIIAVCCMSIGYLSVKVLGPNNPIEEVAEEVLESDIGVKVPFEKQPLDPAVTGVPAQAKKK
jgi:hypothetical protein